MRYLSLIALYENERQKDSNYYFKKFNLCIKQKKMFTQKFFLWSFPIIILPCDFYWIMD